MRATTSVWLAIAGALLSIGAAQTCAASPMKQRTAPTPEGEVLLLDQLMLKGTLPRKVVGELGPAHSMQAVIAIFDRRGLQFERTAVAIATKDIPATLLIKINKLPPGEPFVLPIRDGTNVNITTVNVVIDRLPADPVYTR